MLVGHVEDAYHIIDCSYFLMKKVKIALLTPSAFYILKGLDIYLQIIQISFIGVKGRSQLVQSGIQ